jgi:hypothetical protein
MKVIIMPIIFSCNQTLLSHLDEIETIEKQNNQSPWPLKTFKKFLTAKDFDYFVFRWFQSHLNEIKAFDYKKK